MSVPEEWSWDFVMELRPKTDRRVIQEDSATSTVRSRTRTSRHELAHLGLSEMMQRKHGAAVRGREGRRGGDAESKGV